jgi:SAM-dependent methyltransferase
VRWLLKAAVQKGVSAIPQPERANYVLQRHVTRSLPVSEATFRKRFARALRHFSAFREHAPGRPDGGAVFYEFGTGWGLEIPLAYWCLGVDRQILADVRPNLRLELVNVTLRRLRALLPELEEAAGRALRDPERGEVGSVRDLADRFGITYCAPLDARATGLEAGSVDFVSSTNTLEHVPAADLVPILAECRRLLRPDGALSARIDLRDHYAGFDRRLSPYNFLRFGDRTWRILNSRLHYQNRLRRPAYLEAFTAAGLPVVAERAARPRRADLVALGKMRLAPEFRRYALDELGVRGLALVAKPAVVRLPDAAQELEDVGRRGGPGVGAGAGTDGGRLGDDR